MAKHKIASITIRPGKNGGHTVRHEYQPQASIRGGGLSMGAPPGEDHNFGPGDGHNMLKHIVSALALKGMSPGGGESPNEEPAEE